MWVEVALPLPMFRLLTYRVPERFWEIARVGQTAIVPIQNRSLKGVIVQLSSDPKSEGMQGKGWKEIQNILNPESVLPSHLLQLTRWVSERYACSWGESLALASLPLYKGKRRLLVPKPTEFVKSESDGTLPYTLSEEQVAAIQTVGQSIQNGEQKTFLLHGVTSSGKTEVYLHAIAETLRKGKQALYLVPEISLCPPFLEILRKRFGNQVGLWHSQVTLKEKEQLLSAIREGRVRILMGARSALFVPLPNPGLFILDEEHDHSYKQQEKPRYHARETALKLGEIVGGVVLLGSATPSVESFYRAERGEFQVLELKSRVASRSFPQLSIVGAGTSAKKATPFSEELIQAITQALFRREQVILALNRRGFSTFLTCVSCGFVWKCRLCQLALVYHKEDQNGDDILICHYCSHSEKVPSRCGQCQSESLFFGGFGTQKVVQEVKRLFPFARVLRLDRDSARKKNASQMTYTTFKEESADILVGTQMVTQGYDFPRVTLVGIVDADTALHHPDFRAAERTHQWVTQAAGRSGRGDIKSQVVVQSALTQHYALRAACEQNYRLFYKEEIEFRRKLFYPPFSQLVLLRVDGNAKKKEVVVSESERLDREIRSLRLDGSQVLGPGPAPKEFLRNRARWHLLVKCLTHNHLTQIVQIAQKFQPKSGVRVHIDVDPYDIL